MTYIDILYRLDEIRDKCSTSQRVNRITKNHALIGLFKSINELILDIERAQEKG
jgi:hypothetical protein